MELDDLKQIWQETQVPNKQKTNIMELIQHKNYGPLAALLRTYRRQMTAMSIIPLMLFMTNLQDIDKVLTSVLFWSYVVFCMGVVSFAFYNYRIVKQMQVMDTGVKDSLQHQITLLEKRTRLEITGLMITLLFFVLLVEVVPYFQHYRMLDKWHSLPLVVRLGAYAGLLILQYFLSRRVKQRKVGRHLSYLKELVLQMQ